MRRNLELEATIVEKYAAVEAYLDERGRRIWAATESRAIGYGGDALVSDATGLSRPTIRKGRRELESGGAEDGRIRRAGAGRPGIEQSQPGIKQALEKLVDPVTRGDPQSPLRWTCKSRAKLAAALSSAGWKVGSTTVGRLLHELGYRLQSVRKSTEWASHPDRNAQFEHINAKADEFLRRAQQVVSVDTQAPILNLAARFVRWGLLVLIAVVVISGYLLPWPQGDALDVLGVGIPSPMDASPALREFLVRVHDVAGHLFVPLLALHVAGAVKHAIFDRRGAAVRMVKLALEGR